MHHTILYNELPPLCIIPTFSTVAAYQTSQIIKSAVIKRTTMKTTVFQKCTFAQNSLLFLVHRLNVDEHCK